MFFLLFVFQSFAHILCPWGLQRAQVDATGWSRPWSARPAQRGGAARGDHAGAKPSFCYQNHSNAGVRRGRSGIALCKCTAHQPREGMNPAAPPPEWRDQDNGPI